MNLPHTHPGLKELLAEGLFSIRRTDNNFNRLPVDLTLEQIVNADAASRMTGYVDSTNNYSARLRWSITKFSRAAVIGEMMEMVGMNKANDCHSELSESRIRRDNNDLKKLIKSIQSSVNPFEMDELDHLINIHTGRSATPDICDSLLNIDALGMKMHDKFVSECLQDEGRFEKAISRNKLQTFVNQGARNKRSQNAVVKKLRCTQYMFGRIAFIATTTTVDLRYLMTFPLTPVPLALCHSDGTMVHTNKCSVFTPGK